VDSFEEFMNEFSHIHSPEAHLSWGLLPSPGLSIVVPFALFLILIFFFFASLVSGIRHASSFLRSARKHLLR
jgi:hypothetical protein